MDGFIKKIFHGVSDEHVHTRFQKFSRGTFTQRASFKASHSAKGYVLLTGNEYANELVRELAFRLGLNKTPVTGVIVSTLNLKDKVPFSGMKQFMGIKQYVISGEMIGNDIVKLVDTLPEAFFALSFSLGTSVLKIKAKAPKSAKPKTGDGPVKPDFCSLKTEDATLIEPFVWEKGWSKIEGQHTYVIEDIELPKDVSDPNELRKQAKRKGKIIRKFMIDGKEQVVEKDFVA